MYAADLGQVTGEQIGSKDIMKLWMLELAPSSEIFLNYATMTTEGIGGCKNARLN